MGFTSRQQNGDEASFSICECVNLRVAPSTRTANSLLLLPPLWMARPSRAELLEMSSAAH